jgi:CRP-like cAMP-binding protein
MTQSTRERLLASAMRVDLPAGGRLFDEGTPARVGLMVSGVMRGYRELPDGRQLTIFYDHAGSLPGLVLAFGIRSPGTIEALTPSTVMLFPTAIMRDLLKNDGQAALVVTEEFAIRATQTLEEITGHVTGSMRDRVGHYLLARVAEHPPSAVPHPHTHDLAVTHQEVADAVGAARETVSRVLTQLEQEGVIKMRPRRINVIDFDALCPVPPSRPLLLTG